MKQINLTIVYYDQPSLIFHVESVIMLNMSNQICHQKLKREYIMSTKKEGRSQQNSLHVGMLTFQIFYFSQGGSDNFTYPSS